MFCDCNSSWTFIIFVRPNKLDLVMMLWAKFPERFRKMYHKNRTTSLLMHLTEHILCIVMMDILNARSQYVSHGLL